MSFKWYIVRVYSGYESKIVKHIDIVVRKDYSKYIGEIKIPTERVYKIGSKDNKGVEKVVFPGYMAIQLVLDSSYWQKICYVITSIDGVTGFLGHYNKTEMPNCVSKDQIHSFINANSKSTNYKNNVSCFPFSVGSLVKINGGAFDGFSGKIEDINYDKNRVKIKVEIFGRYTPIDLDFDQIEFI